MLCGITNTGQLFSVSLEMKETSLRPVCPNDRIVSIAPDMKPRNKVLD
jgi:hypothetical protein